VQKCISTNTDESVLNSSHPLQNCFKCFVSDVQGPETKLK